MRVVFLFAALLLGICAAQQLPNEADWNLRLEKEGVLVFTRPMQDYPVEEYLALTLIDGNIDSAFAIISDPLRFFAADPYADRTRVLAKVNDQESYLWYEVKMPVLEKKYDLVARMHTSQTSKGYMVLAQSAPDYLPAEKGYSRVENSSMMIGLRKTDENQFELMCRGFLFPSEEIASRYLSKMIVTSTYDRIDGVRKQLMNPVGALGLR